MSKDIIKTIKIDIAGTEVEVTPQQAKDLHMALAGLLGLDKKPEQKVIEREVYRDRWHPYWPYVTKGITTTGSPDYGKWTVSYSAQANSASIKIQ